MSRRQIYQTIWPEAQGALNGGLQEERLTAEADSY
jgi:hypothetical protein